VSGPQATEELSQVRSDWEMKTLDDLYDAINDGKQVLLRRRSSAAP